VETEKIKFFLIGKQSYQARSSEAQAPILLCRHQPDDGQEYSMYMIGMTFVSTSAASC